MHTGSSGVLSHTQVPPVAEMIDALTEMMYAMAANVVNPARSSVCPVKTWRVPVFVQRVPMRRQVIEHYTHSKYGPGSSIHRAAIVQFEPDTDPRVCNSQIESHDVATESIPKAHGGRRVWVKPVVNRAFKKGICRNYVKKE
jgi:hypothetical protein